MINSIGQLHFGGVSSKVVCFVSFGVVLFYPDLHVYIDFTCNTAQCFHQECKVTTAIRWAEDFSHPLYQTAVPRIH